MQCQRGTGAGSVAIIVGNQLLARMLGTVVSRSGNWEHADRGRINGIPQRKLDRLVTYRACPFYCLNTYRFLVPMRRSTR